MQLLSSASGAGFKIICKEFSGVGNNVCKIAIGICCKFISHVQIDEMSVLLLSGQSLLSVTIAVRDEKANVVATAFGYFPYNQYSKWASTAWGGLVSVDEAQRRKKLGVHVNALMVRGCIDRLGATEVQEYAAATNMPSRKMIERSGLELNPDLVSGVATLGKTRFTA